MAVESLPELLEALRRDPADILGTAESEWVEFKGEPYRLEEDPAKLELAKDVTAIANSRSGAVVLGISTEKNPTNQKDIANELRPIPDGLVSPVQILSVVRDWVYPRLELDIDHYELAGKSGFLWSITPLANRDDYPYIVRGALTPNEKVRRTRNYFGIYERTIGADNVPIDAERVHTLIQKGSQPSSTPSQQPSVDAGISLEEGKAVAEERFHEDLAALELEDTQPFWWFQIAPSEITALRNFFENSSDSLWRALMEPASVRPNGFGLPLGRTPVNIDTGIRIASRDLSLSILHSGTMTVIVGPTFLTWGMDKFSNSPITVNSLALTEIAVSALLFYQTQVIPRLDPQPAGWVWRTGIGHLSKNHLFMPKFFHTNWFYHASDLNVLEKDWKSEWKPVMSISVEPLAAQVLGQVCLSFHLSEGAIPGYEGGRVSIEELSKY